MLLGAVQLHACHWELPGRSQEALGESSRGMGVSMLYIRILFFRGGSGRFREAPGRNAMSELYVNQLLPGGKGVSLKLHCAPGRLLGGCGRLRLPGLGLGPGPVPGPAPGTRLGHGSGHVLGPGHGPRAGPGPGRWRLHGPVPGPVPGLGPVPVSGRRAGD